MKIHAPRQAQQGSTMVEVLVSVLLFSVGVVGLLRSLGTAVRDSGEVEYRSVAAALADERIGRRWTDRPNLANYAETNTAVSDLPNGTRSSTVNGNVVTVTVRWQMPGSISARQHSVSATIAGN